MGEEEFKLKTKEQWETVGKQWKFYGDVLEKISKGLLPLELQLEQQYTDTIKNIAIISGAIASFSLTLFSSSIKKIDDLLILGVSLLLVNVVITFSHLVRRNTKNLENLKHEKDKAVPLREMTEYSRKFYFGEISFEEWNKLEIGLDERLKEVMDAPPPNANKVSHVDDLSMIILGTAVILVVLSFLLPTISNGQPSSIAQPQSISSSTP